MNSWFSTFSQCMELETIEALLLDDLEVILSWFISTDSEDSYKRKLHELYGEQEFIRRFEELIDRLIIGDYAVGDMFPLSLSESDAKKRYRQLIRIFHPDRGAKSEKWLTYRAEKINKAYQLYQATDNDSNCIAYPGESSIATDLPSANKSKKQSKTTFIYQPNAWRSRLGSAKQFQQRVVLSLSLLSVFLVSIFYFSSQDYHSSSDIVVINEYDDSTVVSSAIDLSSDREGADNIKESANIDSAYFFDSKAKEILDEAEWLNRDLDDDILGLVAGNAQQVDMNNLHTQDKKLLGLVNGDAQLNVSDDKETSEVASNHKTIKESKPKLIQVKNDSSHRGSSASRIQLSNPVCDLSLPDSLVNKQLYYVLRPTNVFKGPSSDCQVISELAEHEFVALVNERDNGRWRLVSKQDSDVVTGWVDITSLSRVLNQKKAVTVKRDDQILLSNSKELINKKDQNISDEISSPLVSVVADMKRYYEIGDGDGVAGLYLSSGRENKIRGDEAIRKYYRKAFSKTVKRQFNYEVDSVAEDNEATAIIEGRMYISLAAKSSPNKLNKINADFSIVLIKIAGDYKIAAFDWIRQ